MNKIELPALHKDMYYFGYGIDIEKPIEMANIIIELQQENKILKENAKHNDKVVDKVNWDNMLLKKENKQLKIQISAREEEYKKLENKLTETENWLRPAILQLMGFAKQDYYWITYQQIDNAKLVPIEFSVMGDGCVKFEKLERGVSDVEA